MKRLTAEFNGVWIHLLIDPGVILFNVEESAKAIGYASTSSLTYHVAKRIKYIGGEKFIDLKAINSAAKKATRTPAVREFASWAKSVVDKELAQQQSAAHIAKQKVPEASAWPFPPLKTEFTLKEVAEKVGMAHSEFIAWMSTEGYLNTYASNGHLKMSRWFKDNGYGKNPLAESGRVSNTIRITQKGLEYIKNRLASQREGNVLTFALVNSAERKRLEAEVDKLIKDSFKKFSSSKYTQLMKAPEVYEIWEDDLIKTVKGIIAQVKLKEKNGTDQG